MEVMHSAVAGHDGCLRLLNLQGAIWARGWTRGPEQANPVPVRLVCGFLLLLRYRSLSSCLFSLYGLYIAFLDIVLAHHEVNLSLWTQSLGEL